MREKPFYIDEDVTWCDIQTNCYDCPFYMDDCDGDEEKLDYDDESVRDLLQRPDTKGATTVPGVLR